MQRTMRWWLRSGCERSTVHESRRNERRRRMAAESGLVVRDDGLTLVRFREDVETVALAEEVDVVLVEFDR